MARGVHLGLVALLSLCWALQLLSLEPTLNLSARHMNSARASLLELREAQAELQLLESRITEQRKLVERLGRKFAEQSLVELGVNKEIGPDGALKSMIVALLEAAADVSEHGTSSQQERRVLENVAAFRTEAPLSLTDQGSELLFASLAEGAGAGELSEGIRKKDSPDNIAQLLEHLRVQQMQEDLRSARLAKSGERARVVLLPPRRLLQKSLLSDHQMPVETDVANKAMTYRWNVTCGPALYEANWYGVIAHCTPAWVGARNTSQGSPPMLELAGADTHDGRRCERVAVDAFASPEECEFVVTATKRAFVGLFHQGGATSLVPDSSSRVRCRAHA